MKIKIQRKHLLNIRPLKPKPIFPMQNLSIQSLSFIHDVIGATTYMIVKPDHITLNSKELISVIEEKKDRIEIGSNEYILVKDLLTAIHNHPSGNDNVNPSSNIDHHNKIVTEEPKRPANAFILYNIALRKKVKNLFPNYNNSDISKLIGGMWKSVSELEKDKYVKQAIYCRKIHKERYPNFEYNIKREATFSCSNISELQVGKNWENYFEWCIQNSTSESSTGVLQYNNESVNGRTASSWSSSVTLYNSTFQELNNFSSMEHQMAGEWNEISQIVAQFFPEESDQNSFMDEQFWNSLDNFECSNDLTFVSNPNFGNSFNEKNS